LDRRLSEYLEDNENFRFKPTLLHTDLHSQHVLWTGDEVTGVIDWGDARIGDPAREFVQWAAHFGTAEVSRFTENRVGPTDHTFVRRVETYRLFRPLWRIHESAFSDNLSQAKDGITWLRRALSIDSSKGWSR
jgi:aminoglycoside 2''-phosphotransferase